MTQGDIALVTVDGTRRTAYLATPASERDSVFSPDGRWMAYASSQSGRAEVYVRAADGRGATWKVSDDGGSLARWRADGKELFYRRESAVIAADIAGDGQLSIGKPHVLFDGHFGHAYDVTPDGQRFLMTRVPEVAPQTQIQVAEGLLQ